jgi:hypothetical protein
VAKQVTKVFEERLEAGFAGIGERVHARVRSPRETLSKRRKLRSGTQRAEAIYNLHLREADHARSPITQ